MNAPPVWATALIDDPGWRALMSLRDERLNHADSKAGIVKLEEAERNCGQYIIRQYLDAKTHIRSFKEEG